MAKNVAHWQYEEDDTVAFLPKSGNGMRIGLVSETHETELSSDDEDDESESSQKLKPGQVRVEWYPTGKETAAMADKIVLIDRSLLMGEVVCRRSQPNRIGSIRNVFIRADFLLLPHCQYVVRNISGDRIEFVNKYDDASSSCYVGYENWAGSLMASSDRLLLKSDEGYQCWISTNDFINDLYDCCAKRLEESSYNTRQWYEGEPVKCTFKSLENAKWVTNYKPSDVMMRKMENSNRKMKFTVLKVEPEFINVRWIAAVGGTNASVHPPPSTISGADLQKVRKLEHFEHQLTQIGDRIWLKIGDDDVVVPLGEWKTNLRRELERDQHRTNPVSNKTESACSTAETISSEVIKNATIDDSANIASSCAKIESNEKKKSESEDVLSVTVDEESEWETPRRSRPRLGVSAHREHRWKHHPNAANVSSPQRKLSAATSTVRKRIKVGQAKTGKAASSRTISPPAIGEKYAGEAIYVRSLLEIMWADGELERDVPSVELAYASGDLDDHLFVPGNYVLLQEDDESKTWPENGYGVVEKVDNVNRVATVSWYEQSAGKRKFIRKDQVSVYELIAHADFDYAPGVLLMKMPSDSAENIDETAPIGQVLFTDVNGEVNVKWMDGRFGTVFPEDVCRVLGDNHLEDDDELDSEANDEESESNAESDSGWSTVSMSNSDGEEDDDKGEDDDDENFDSTLGSDANVKPKDSIGSLTKILTALETLRGNLLTLRKSEAEIDVRGDLAAALIRTYSTLKRVTKCWFELDLNAHRYGGDLSSCVRILRTWVKAMKESGSANVVAHPAKDNGNSVETRLDIESQLDTDLAFLCQVEEELKKYSDDNAINGAQAASSISSTSDGGWIGLMRKTLRDFLRQVQSQTSVGFRWRSTPGGSSLSPQDEEKFQLAQRLLQRGLAEQMKNENGVGSSDANNGESEADKEFLTINFRSIVSDCTNRCFESNPKQKRALAIVDLSASAVLMISRSIIEQLVQAERRGVKTKTWDDVDAVAADKDEKTETDNGNKTEKEDEEFLTAEESQQSAVSTINSKTAEKIDNSDRDELCNGADEGEKEVDSNEKTAVECFELLEKAPDGHTYFNVAFNATSAPSRFMKAIRQEMKLLQTSLPTGVYVKAFEDRMNLYSCMLVGPSGTPYADGLFFFDVHLKQSYPTEPPIFHFKSFSTEQLNPNLYQDGKVCVSLLGTWNGKDSEMWNPGSNLLQVLVSIQGLILNAEPYFNEAGYESRRAHPESVEKSRRYNELALIRTIESLWKLSSNLPPSFEKDVRRHLQERGRKHIETVEKWIDGKMDCGFPLQPVSQGFALSAKKQLAKLVQALTNMGF